jgi:hypothetical protein
MKHYSIMAAVVAVLLAAGAGESQACVAGTQNPVTDARPAEAQPPANIARTDLDRSQTSSDKGNGSAAKAEAASFIAPNSESQNVFYILAEFKGSLNVKKLKPGDPIKAEVTQDVLTHGKIVIPVESKLVGHVTEVKESSGEDRESRLGFVFDKVLLKHHQELGVQGVLQALSPPAPRTSKLDEPDPIHPPLPMIPNQPSNVPMGGTPTRASTGPSPALPTSNLPSENMTTVVARPNGSLVVRAVPGGNSGMALKRGGELAVQQPMSAGMPQGVFGLKGLSLATGSRTTPGPIILSATSDIKLEDGTQVLLRVTDVPVP